MREDRMARVREEAARWSVLLRQADSPPEQVAEWLEWIGQDPAHLEAFDQVEALAGGLDGLTVEQKSALLERYASSAAAGRRRRALLALAAGLVLAVAGALFWQSQRHLPFAATFVTAKAENRDLTLPDGTRVTLGAGTQLDVNFTPDERAATLRNGEAYFAVAPGSARPFVVIAGDLRITDIGTDFDIRKIGEHVTVTVADGIVDVRKPSGGAQAQVIRLVAGEQIRIAAADGEPVVTKVDAARAAAWRSGRLEFQDETLAVVVANVNRYAERELVIVDPAVAEMRFTGTVFRDRIGDWLTGTAHLFRLRTEEAADGRILLYAQ